MTSQYAEVISQENGIPLVKSQHHHAHTISVAAENFVPKEEEIIGIALDGAGYGSDGTIWGGEILKSSYSSFERSGSLEILPMPGGDLCAFYPYRMLIAAISKEINDEIIRDITKNHIEEALPHGLNELDIILKQGKRSNIMKTTSAGRFLDSIAALIDLVYHRTYEGEPAMKLEALATKGDPNLIQIDPIISKDNGKYTLKTSEILYNLLENKKKYKKEDIAAFGQKYLAKGISDITVKISEDTGLDKVGLSGGVLVNGYINRYISNKLEKEGLSVLYQQKVPPGDGGTALGQAIKALNYVI
jgi:hydrogenase maturation protein HypF